MTRDDLLEDIFLFLDSVWADAGAATVAVRTTVAEPMGGAGVAPMEAGGVTPVVAVVAGVFVIMALLGPALGEMSSHAQVLVAPSALLVAVEIAAPELVAEEMAVEMAVPELAAPEMAASGMAAPVGLATAGLAAPETPAEEMATPVGLTTAGLAAPETPAEEMAAPVGLTTAGLAAARPIAARVVRAVREEVMVIEDDDIFQYLDIVR